MCWIARISLAGTGIKRIKSEVKKHGSPAPTFDSTGFFTITFWPLFKGGSNGKGVHEGVHEGVHDEAHDEAHEEAHDEAHDEAQVEA